MDIIRWISCNNFILDDNFDQVIEFRYEVNEILCKFNNIFFQYNTSFWDKFIENHKNVIYIGCYDIYYDYEDLHIYEDMLKRSLKGGYPPASREMVKYNPQDVIYNRLSGNVSTEDSFAACVPYDISDEFLFKLEKINFYNCSYFENISHIGDYLNYSEFILFDLWSYKNMICIVYRDSYSIENYMKINFENNLKIYSYY